MGAGWCCSQTQDGEAGDTCPQPATGETRIDLHVHTALSPCGDVAMRPGEILLTCERRGIGVVGIADHSTARNARAVMDAAPAFAVRVLVGLEVESAEGVHILSLFDNADAALEMDEVIAAHLPRLSNRPEVLGSQHLLDEWGNLLRVDDRLLVTATDLSIDEIARITISLDGLAIPAHVDRPLNGLFSMLGFVPPGLQAKVFEVSAHTSPEDARRKWPELERVALVTGSDAHYLGDIGRAFSTVPTEIALADMNAGQWGEELAKALRGGPPTP